MLLTAQSWCRRKCPRPLERLPVAQAISISLHLALHNTLLKITYDTRDWTLICIASRFRTDLRRYKRSQPRTNSLVEFPCQCDITSPFPSSNAYVTPPSVPRRLPTSAIIVSPFTLVSVLAFANAAGYGTKNCISQYVLTNV